MGARLVGLHWGRRLTSEIEGGKDSEGSEGLSDDSAASSAKLFVIADGVVGGRTRLRQVRD